MFYGGSADSPQIREWLPPEKVSKQKFPWPPRRQTAQLKFSESEPV